MHLSLTSCPCLENNGQMSFNALGLILLTVTKHRLKKFCVPFQQVPRNIVQYNKIQTHVLDN